tara:strand:- start:88 stop:1383 length:1296 start_codon:yes stop_codon:yes gene_type:complete
MFITIKKYINIFISNFSGLLIYLFISLRLFFFCSLIFRINLRKIKKIPCSSNKKKIIVLPKSGGYEDLLASYSSSQLKNDIAFFTIPRQLIKVVYHYCLKDSAYPDYLTLRDDKETIIKRKKYRDALKKIFLKLNKIWEFDGIIGFNIFYYAEHDVHQVINEIKKKSIIMHKESVFPEAEHQYNKIVYPKNEKFNGNIILAYSDREKNMLVNTGLAREDQVGVPGCARLDLAFDYQKISQDKNLIVYYIIEKERPVPGESSFVNWIELKEKTENFLIQYGKNNPQIKIIFKGKVGVHKRNELPNDLPKNCIFINTGAGHKFLKKAKVVVAFNSSAVFEAIAALRNLIIPNYDPNISLNEDNLLILPSTKYLVNNFKEFNQQLNYFLNENNKDNEGKKLTKEEEEILDYYFGNKDGCSGLRTKKFLDNVILN